MDIVSFIYDHWFLTIVFLMSARFTSSMTITR